MVQMRTAIPIEDAIRRVMESESNGLVEYVQLTEALGRFLAEDVIADQDVPAFNRSLYDGYAIKAEDTRGELPVDFEVIGKIGAGDVFSGRVEAFQAVRIMTGAQVPADCNAVVMLEHVESHIEEDGRIYITVQEVVPYGERVFFKGKEVQAGSCMVKKGTAITPGVVGLLATFGYSKVAVSKRPIVGVLATGSELLEIDEPLYPGKIRNSNSYMLVSQIERAGGEAVFLGIIEDDFEKSLSAVRAALEKVDILITTGGVSVGDYDYMPDIYKGLGATVLFNKVAMRPGSVTTVAKRGRQLLFGLSGNPSACYIGFELFVRPVIRKNLGSKQMHPACVKAMLTEDFPAPKAFTQLIRVKMSYEYSRVTVSSVGLNLSGSITSLAGADALLVLMPREESYKQGSEVPILLLSEREGQEQIRLGSD